MEILAIFAIGLILAFTAKPKKTSSPSPSSIDASDIPTAEAGKPIPIVIGTVLCKDANVTWWGDVRYEPIKK
jgi:hypothetical protein